MIKYYVYESAHFETMFYGDVSNYSQRLFSGVVVDPETVEHHSDVESIGPTELPQTVSEKKDRVICVKYTQYLYKQDKRY